MMRRMRHTLERDPVPHRARPQFDQRMPVHVTVRMAEHVWTLQSGRSLRALDSALSQGTDRFGARIVLFALIGDQIHLLVEADNTESLLRAMKGLGVRISKGLNRMMGTRGSALDGRYHCRLLSTPAEVSQTVSFIRGIRSSSESVAPYTSETVDVELPSARTSLVVQALRPPRGG
jgi:REP element-mobilizing transposase RayT